jgi:hypothetical protein
MVISLEPVEYPGDAERCDHKIMESAPGQAIEPRGDIGIDGGGRRLLALANCVYQELHPHRSRSSWDRLWCQAAGVTSSPTFSMI